MLKRVLLTLLTLLVVACMVGSVIAMAGTVLLLRENSGKDQSSLWNTVDAPAVVLILESSISGRVLDGIGYSSN